MVDSSLFRPKPRIGSLMSFSGIVGILGSTVITAASFSLFQTTSTALANSNTDERGIVVTERENGSRIQISRGAVLTIRLETIPGTGYGWKLMKSETLKLKLIGEELEIAGKSMPGTPAHSVFQFLSEQPGKSTIELQYVRAWEKDVSPRKTYKIEVNTRPPA